jgi:hypothetical protein
MPSTFFDVIYMYLVIVPDATMYHLVRPSRCPVLVLDVYLSLAKSDLRRVRYRAWLQQQSCRITTTLILSSAVQDKRLLRRTTPLHIAFIYLVP